jgi:hypothetical protein
MPSGSLYALFPDTLARRRRSTHGLLGSGTLSSTAGARANADLAPQLSQIGPAERSVTPR